MGTLFSLGKLKNIYYLTLIFDISYSLLRAQTNRDFEETLRKDCFQNKSKFITEDHFTKHMNITIC
jgi:hypothetical protein